MKSASTYFCLVHKLPDNDRHDKEWYTNIGGDEISRTPVSFQENWEPCDQGNDGRPNEAIPSSEGL
jgi:hypothetical protein